jgi:hypothetical protein
MVSLCQSRMAEAKMNEGELNECMSACCLYDSLLAMMVFTPLLAPIINVMERSFLRVSRFLVHCWIQSLTSLKIDFTARTVIQVVH